MKPNRLKLAAVAGGAITLIVLLIWYANKKLGATPEPGATAQITKSPSGYTLMLTVPTPPEFLVMGFIYKDAVAPFIRGVDVVYMGSPMTQAQTLTPLRSPKIPDQAQVYVRRSSMLWKDRFVDPLDYVAVAVHLHFQELTFESLASKHDRLRRLATDIIQRSRVFSQFSGQITRYPVRY